MAIFAIHYTYPDDVTEMLTIRPEHREWLSGQPGLLVAGMYQDGIDELSEGEPTDQEPANAALIVYSADSLEAVSETFDQDPYWLGGPHPATRRAPVGSAAGAVGRGPDQLPRLRPIARTPRADNASRI